MSEARARLAAAAFAPHAARPQRSSVAFAPEAATPAYHAAVAALRERALAVGFYIRPYSKGVVARDQGGSALVRPPEERLVGVSDDMGAHIRAALLLDFPQPELEGGLEADLSAAIGQCVDAGGRLPEWRARRTTDIRAIAASLHSSNASLLRRVTGAKRSLVSGMNLAFMAAFIDAVGWPDVDAVRCFVEGFPIVGDIPDSGLFRPLLRPATVQLDSFTPESNGAWASDLAKSLARGAASAEGDDLAALRELESVTRKEACAGYVRGPYSRGRLDAILGAGLWRAMRRFGVWQGEGDARKLRAIDNARGALLSLAATTYETLHCITLFFVVLVVGGFARACAQRRVPFPPLRIGLDDMRAAYRRIPVNAPWYTVFALWSFVRRAVVYYYLPGHNFGFGTAVLNFNRFPHLMCAMARVLFAVPCAHFFDDYVIVDAAAGGASGQEALAEAHALVGQELEPKKRKPMASGNVALGQHVDVSRAHVDQTVTVSPLRQRCRNILAALRAARQRNHLSTGEAARVRGKLGWVLSAAFGRVGRAATQPLTEREYALPGTDRSWSAALDGMLEFYEVLLGEDAEGSLRLPSLVVSAVRWAGRPIVVYSDAMFRRVGGRWASSADPSLAADLLRDARGRPFSRVGFTVFVPGRRPVVARAVLPEWVYAYLSADAFTLIQQAELIAAVGVYRTLASDLSGTAAVHFVDNTGALSNLIHGYASRPDCARLANAFHLGLAAMGTKVWLEWVPSKANVADLPSRDDDLALLEALEAAGFEEGFEEVDFEFPPAESWVAPLAQFAGW